jgi:hypothetical protein
VDNEKCREGGVRLVALSVCGLPFFSKMHASHRPGVLIRFLATADVTQDATATLSTATAYVVNSNNSSNDLLMTAEENSVFTSKSSPVTGQSSAMAPALAINVLI